MRRLENALAGVVSGPAGRMVAFTADFAAALWRGLRGRFERPEQG